MVPLMREDLVSGQNELEHPSRFCMRQPLRVKKKPAGSELFVCLSVKALYNL